LTLQDFWNDLQFGIEGVVIKLMSRWDKKVSAGIVQRSTWYTTLRTCQLTDGSKGFWYKLKHDDGAGI
jgi:hypothetical protein